MRAHFSATKEFGLPLRQTSLPEKSYLHREEGPQLQLCPRLKGAGPRTSSTGARYGKNSRRVDLFIPLPSKELPTQY
ncbi:hypothetical protein NPIL_582181 [Nephila pilipes]|uniref:Uncharacterized protein n=1 Tax=Nephila pilipes TaxID=299642 RepID=A0A8X6TEL5_NEPPI|nr:hypothetical protein NPIL_582181 [Nephila pilipes]